MLNGEKNWKQKKNKSKRKLKENHKDRSLATAWCTNTGLDERTEEQMLLLAGEGKRPRLQQCDAHVIARDLAQRKKHRLCGAGGQAGWRLGRGVAGKNR